MSAVQAPNQMMPTQKMGDPLSPGKVSIYSVFHTVVAFFAIFLSFKCNNGFHVGDFLIALLCPHLYIIYRFAVSDTFCGIRR